MRPTVPLRAPQQVGLRRVAHHDDGVDARRCRDQRGSDGGADAARLGRADARLRLERAADAAHHIRAFERDLGGGRGARAGEDRLALRGRETERAQRARHGFDGDLGGDIAVERGIGVGLLEGDDLRVAVAAVGGDDHACTGVVDAVGERLVAEATEHRRVHDARALAGLGPVQLLGDVGHVDGDAIAGLEAEPTQRDRAARRLEQQLPARHAVGDHRTAAAAVERLVPTVALEEERGLGAVPGEHMPIQFIEAGVGQRTVEPTIERGFAVVEGAAPGGVVGGERRRHRGTGARVVAAPSARSRIEAQPGAVRTDGGLEPVDLAAGDVGVVGARVAGAGLTGLLPRRAGGEGVDDGRRGGDSRRRRNLFLGSARTRHLNSPPPRSYYTGDM